MSSALLGQTTNPSYVPTITPKAPDAAALMKFTDVPVSPYTGTASVSVPIYTIKAKGITIPVSIDYHTGGIRLEEEASSVGLGWALNGGGMITRTINDQDDLGGSSYFNNAVPQKQGELIGYQPANGLSATDQYAQTDSLLQHNCPQCSVDENCSSCPVAGDRYIFYFNCSYNVNFTGGTGDFTEPFSLIGTDPWDLEPDTYSFNFLGHSGKFIIKRDEVTVVMEKQDNIKIQVLQPGSTPSSIVFVITDESGNKFFFNTTQSCYPAWKSGSTPTSWYLSQIITQQNDVITFNYSQSGQTTVASETSQTINAIGNGPSALFYESQANTIYNNVNLSSIDYKDGQIQFFTEGNRQDLLGGIKLDSVRIFSKTTAGLKYLKSDQFYYSYFNAAGGSSTVYSEFGDNPNELERLRLDSVKELSGGNALKPYSFVYNGVPAAYGEKHSYSIDHWGYYNGAGNTQLIPSASVFYMGNNCNLGPFIYNYSGANRDPSFLQNAEYFSLHRVNYPTGGSTIFNYEQNTYDYNNSLSRNLEFPQQTLATIDTILHLQQANFSGSSTINGVIDFSKISQIIAPGQGGTNATIIITFRSNNSSTGWSGADKNTFGKLYFEFGSNITDIGSSGLNCGTGTNPGPVCSLSYRLAIAQASPTAYTWTAHWDPSAIPAADLAEIEVEVSFQGLQTVAQNNPTLTAGGLRIHSIIDSTATGAVKQRVWNYHHGSTNQYSNGVLMSFPSYVRNEYQPGPCGGISPVMVMFSSSSTQPTSAIGGNIVGYSHVTETMVDPSSNADNGEIVYSYINTPDTIISYNTFRMPGMQNLGNNLNGSEISRITYQDKGSGNYWKLSETDNSYHTTNKSIYYSAKYRQSQSGQNKWGNCFGAYVIPDQGMGEFFPSIKSERILQDATTNIVYDPADTTKFLTSTTNYYYDDTKHYYVTRSKTVDSKGNTHVSKITYPQDYIIPGNTTTGNQILDTLISKNMVAETIEKQDSLYYPGNTTGYVTAASETRFKQLSSGPMVNDKEYKLDIVNPVTNFVPMSQSGSTFSHDSRYRQLISFDKYDSFNNIAQYTLLNELPVSIIWDYKKVSPIAQVKGAALADCAYTSFEADSAGNWTISSATRDATTAITGAQSYNLSGGNSVSKGLLTSTTTYVVSYWTKNTSPLTITGTITGYPIKGATINGWTYYEHKVTGQTSITVSGTGNIDELRLYPQNAQMTSYTYAPEVGVTTISDARGGINYYEYDNFQRLLDIKDQNGNIVKSFTYHYAGQ